MCAWDKDWWAAHKRTAKKLASDVMSAREMFLQMISLKWLVLTCVIAKRYIPHTHSHRTVYLCASMKFNQKRHTCNIHTEVFFINTNGICKFEAFVKRYHLQILMWHQNQIKILWNISSSQTNEKFCLPKQRAMISQNVFIRESFRKWETTHFLCA